MNAHQLNSQKIILDLCGGSGAWSFPYKKNGYNVQVVTLPENNIFDFEPPTNVYGILAAPPCTEFSIAKGNHPRDFKKAMLTVKRCLEIIWSCESQSHLQFWVLENPTGLLRRFLGQPKMSFQPWYYGDFWTKRTDLWGCFNPPKRYYYARPLLLPMTKHGDHKGQICLRKKPVMSISAGLDCSQPRAITPYAFASEFFRANP